MERIPRPAEGTVAVDKPGMVVIHEPMVREGQRRDERVRRASLRSEIIHANTDAAGHDVQVLIGIEHQRGSIAASSGRQLKPSVTAVKARPYVGHRVVAQHSFIVGGIGGAKVRLRLPSSYDN